MDPISEKIVEDTWKEVGSTSLTDAPLIAKEFSSQQPYVSVYLLASGGDELNQDEREVLYYVGLMVWKIMTKGSKKIEKISAEALENAEDNNWAMVEDLSKVKEEIDFIKVIESFVENYNQKNVLKYVLEVLLEHDPDEVNLRKQNIGMMFIYLKTVIDCLDQ
jgi:hypothetical protein